MIWKLLPYGGLIIESHSTVLRSLFRICLLQGEVGAPGEMGPIGETGIQVCTRSISLKIAVLKVDPRRKAFETKSLVLTKSKYMETFYQSEDGGTS